MIKDMIDMHSCILYSSQPNIKSWGITVPITSITLSQPNADSGGVAPGFDRSLMNARWADIKPTGWQGYIQSTLWAGFQINSLWHLGAFSEFWSDRNGPPRLDTGAPILYGNNWKSNWAYDPSRWGALCSYQPKEGDIMAVMLTAGDVRAPQNRITVQERSQIVTFPLTKDAVYTFGDSGPVPPPVNPPSGNGVTAEELSVQLAALRADIAAMFMNTVYSGKARAFGYEADLELKNKDKK